MDLSYFEEDYESLVSEAVIDEEGVETSPVVYETLQRIKKRPRTKSHADVLRVIEKQGGKNEAVVDMFISSYLNGIQWNWLEEYQEYESDLDGVVSWNDEHVGNLSHTATVRIVTGEGDDAVVSYEEQDVLYEAKEIPVEPVRPYQQTIAEWRLENYDILRAASYPSVEDQLEMIYNDRVNGTDLWVERQIEVKSLHAKGNN